MHAFSTASPALSGLLWYSACEVSRRWNAQKKKNESGYLIPLETPMVLDLSRGL